METQQSTDQNDDEISRRNFESIGKHKAVGTSFTKINRPRQQGQQKRTLNRRSITANRLTK
jgi:hypothetical protein